MGAVSAAYVSQITSSIGHACKPPSLDIGFLWYFEFVS